MLSTGNGDTASNSWRQKWPAIDVIATCSAPAARSRCVRRSKTAACRLAVVTAQIGDQLRGVGVDDGQLQRPPGSGVSGGDVAIVELGRRGTDATDEADVHD